MTEKEISDALCLVEEQYIIEAAPELNKKYLKRVMSYVVAAGVFLAVAAFIYTSLYFAGEESVEPDLGKNSAYIMNYESEQEESMNQIRNDINISINYLSEEPQSKAFYAIIEDFFKEMGREELLNYYGLNELDISGILKDFKEVNTDRYGIYYLGDGVTECYGHHFTWEDENSGKNITIELAKDRLPLSAPFSMSGEGAWSESGKPEVSSVNGVDMIICYYNDGFDNGCYHAQFINNGIGYLVNAKNLCEEDFLSVLIYLTENN